MLFDREPLEDRIKLRAVADLLSGDVEALHGRNILAMDMHLSLCGVDLTSQRFEASSLSSSADSE